jgi:hypothetical protein
MAGLVRIGCAAGFAGDRSDSGGPIVAELARASGPRFLIFETLGERTLALCHLERRRDPSRGYNPALERFLTPVLGRCLASGIRIVGNFGGANPRAAGERIAALARAAGFPAACIAIVEGDDVTAALPPQEFARREIDGRLLAEAREIVSASAYLGADEIAEALDGGAEIVVTGRVADPSLALGPLRHAFGWRRDDWHRLAAGTLAGHLLECGAQVTGGYFADPGLKDVPDMDRLGYPIAEVEESGRFVVTKPADSGGVVDRRTVTEQILYEIHDPAAYLTPDVVLDITEVELAEAGRDRIAVGGARGRPAPEKLKATVCVDGGVLGEAEISYAGPNAAARARLAVDTVKVRMARIDPDLAVRADALGLVSVLGDSRGRTLDAAWSTVDGGDVRVRFAAQAREPERAVRLLDEVEALYCAGPAGGGGMRRHITPRLWSASCLIERELVKPRVSFLGAAS